ncbi:MAG: 50S ribosomal protein L10 [bacterium]|nr:50S ribosomal protein L10 [bacterium]
MKTKAQKSAVIKDLSSKIPESDMIVFTSFSKEGEKGLSVAKMQELKRALKKLGAEYVVAKKNLIRLSVKSAHLEEKVDVDGFDGSVGVVLSGKGGDGLALSKNVYEFSKGNPVFRVLGAIFEHQFVDPIGFTALAKLPSREVLLARAVGMIQYPLTGLMNVMQGNIKNLLLVLKNIKKD